MIVLDLLDVKITCWGGICHRARLRDHYVLYENVVNFKNKHLSTIICSDWNDMVEGQKNNNINKNSYNMEWSFKIENSGFQTSKIILPVVLSSTMSSLFLDLTVRIFFPKTKLRIQVEKHFFQLMLYYHHSTSIGEIQIDFDF